MSLLEQIRRPVEDLLRECRTYMCDRMTADDPFVQSMLDYIIGNMGKGVRPLLVLLSSRLHAEGVALGERTNLAAMLVEMIHTASLVHDDVIDESPMRRGNPSVNNRWGANSAVLCGDYILATAFDAGMTSGHYDIPTFIISAMRQLCSGELVQNECNRTSTMTRELYLDIINKKTAVLLSTSAAVGAVAVGASRECVERMTEFGTALGMAFQIKDDILDYDVDAQTGKPSCNDLREGKITLPLLSVLESADECERQRLVALLQAARTDECAVEQLREIVTTRGGLQAAQTLMDDYMNRARAVVAMYPASDVRRSLELLCEFVAARNN
ncbi:MAG: polyprenyl synthetase family protein [Rikenellaceae bacterium]|nr:polyprenyl synthetase family protein [Rikenellaceae bacterium]